MAWSTPRTWNAGETVTSTIMNTHVRDQLNVLKTRLEDSGKILGEDQLDAKFTDVSNSGSGETDIYSYTLPANYLSTDGWKLIIDIFGVTAANGNTKTWKIYFAGTATTFRAAADSALGVALDNFSIMRRSSSTAQGYGQVTHGANFSGVIGPSYTGVDFTVGNVIKLTLQGTSSADATARTWSIRRKRF